MNRLYISLGSNMGNPEQKLREAVSHIGNKLGKIQRCSSIYQTAAWGKTDQPDFLNQVIIAETRMDARTAMQVLLGIEKEMGRIRTEKNAPRVIDLDILFCNHEQIDLPELQIPHPHIAGRRFVLVPLNELSPLFRHPGLGRTIHQLLQDCADPLNVKKF